MDGAVLLCPRKSLRIEVQRVTSGLAEFRPSMHLLAVLGSKRKGELLSASKRKIETELNPPINTTYSQGEEISH